MNGKARRIKAAVRALLASEELRATWLAALRRVPELVGFAMLVASPPLWDPTSQELASIAGIGERTLRDRVKDLIGLTPMEAIVALRLARVVGELRRANSSIHAVAQREGYADVCAFDHQFMRYFGECPSIYAAAIRQRRA